MARSESLYIPEVQRKSIRLAREQEKPFAVLASEQRVLGLWLSRRFQVFDEKFALNGLDVRMSEVKQEVAIAYVAMKHAFKDAHGTTLPKLKETTLIDYFQRISPGVVQQPHTGKPLDSPNRVILQNVINLFGDRQPYLMDRIESRFDNPEDENMLSHLDSTLICGALGWHMLEVQTMLQNEGFAGA